MILQAFANPHCPDEGLHAWMKDLEAGQAWKVGLQAKRGKNMSYLPTYMKDLYPTFSLMDSKAVYMQGSLLCRAELH